MNTIKRLNTVAEAIAFKKSINADGTGTIYLLCIDGKGIESFHSSETPNPIVLNSENINDREIIRGITNGKLFGDTFDYSTITDLVSESELSLITDLRTTFSGLLANNNIQLSQYDISDMTCLSKTQITDIAGYDGTKYKNMFGMTSLISVELPETVKEIGLCAFAFCISLTNIKLPKTLESIKTKSFYNCINLRELTIPAQVSLIEKNSFNRCSNLMKLTFKGMPAKVYADTFKGLPDNYTLYVPKKYYEEYISAWERFSDHIKSY